MNKQKKKILILVLSAILLIAALCTVYFLTRPKTDDQAKTITVQVVFSETENKEYAIKTNEEFLRGALEQEKLIGGNESKGGLFVITVADVTADESKQQWWCFTKSGESLMEGVDTIAISDGDHFEITLTTGF